MDNKKLKRKFARVGKEKGMYALGIVTSPAIKEGALFLSEEKDNIVTINLKDDAPTHFKFSADKKQKVIMGPVLIPGIDILRKNRKTGEFYNLQFTVEDIAEINKQQHLKKLTDNYTLEHKVKVDGLTQIENWVVLDSVLDKSNKLGIPQPVGTLMRATYVDSDAQFEALSKNFNGYSIEADLELYDDPNTMNLNEETKVKEMKNKFFLANLFNFTKTASKLKLTDYPLADGMILMIDDATGAATIDGQTPADGEYQLADGSIAVITNGLLTDIMQPNDNIMNTETTKLDATASAPAPAVATIPAPATKTTTTTKVVESETPAAAAITPTDENATKDEKEKVDIESLKAELDKMKSVIAELTTAKTKLEEEKVELSKKIRGEAKIEVLPLAKNTGTEKIKMSDLVVDKVDRMFEMMNKS